jgi:hypothetical protein
MSKTILITGASSGFGRDTAETLRHAGHSVYASMRGVQGKNREAAEALRKLGVKTVELDVSDDTSVEAGVKTVLAEAGKIDVLVNNAGIASAGVTEASGPPAGQQPPRTGTPRTTPRWRRPALHRPPIPGRYRSVHDAPIALRGGQPDRVLRQANRPDDQSERARTRKSASGHLDDPHTWRPHGSAICNCSTQ